LVQPRHDNNEGRVRTRSLLVWIVCPLLLAAGCSRSSGGGQAGRPYDVALIQGVRGDEFYTSMACGAREAARRLGVNLSVAGADKWGADVQTPVINAVAAKRPDAVLVVPNDVRASIAPLQQMKQNGIKVVEVDTYVNDSSISLSRIATDNLGAGRESAKALARLIGDRSGSVLMVNVKPGISTTDERAQGFQEEIKRHPNLQFLGVQYDDDVPARAAEIVEATHAGHKDLVGIFAANVLSAEGSATGVKHARASQVKIVAFDASPKEVEDLRSGTVHALVSQKPFEIGRLGVEQAVRALRGESVRRQIETGFVVVTRQRLDDPNFSKYLYKSSC
jgi:ribose transport system substrate-binding protein